MLIAPAIRAPSDQSACPRTSVASTGTRAFVVNLQDPEIDLSLDDSRLRFHQIKTYKSTADVYKPHTQEASVDETINLII